MKQYKLCSICKQAPTAHPKGKFCQRCLHIRYKFKVDPKDIIALRDKQHGVCAICHCLPNPKRDFALDHDHESTQIRGLLCTSCNVGLGNFQHDPELLMNAIRYLQQPPQLIDRLPSRQPKPTNFIEVQEKVLQDTTLPTLRAKARALAAHTGCTEECAMSSIRRHLARF